MKKFTAYAAPKRYIFEDPDTRTIFEGTTKKELVDKVIAFRKQNKLEELEGISAVIDNYLCCLPENAGACEEMKMHRSWIEYPKGGFTLLKNMLYRSFVSQKEADRRASICVECPHNIFPDKKGFIKWSDNVAELSVEDRKSVHHAQLGNCGVCSCTLKAKVFYNGDMGLTKKQEEQILNSNPKCWQVDSVRDRSK